MDPMRRPYDHQLAGVIRHGEQIEASAALSNKLKALFCDLGRHYIMSLGEANGLAFKPTVQVSFRTQMDIVLNPPNCFHGQDCIGLSLKTAQTP